MKVGVALGGGGVRGLAHISVLEALDQLGLRPSVVAGTSMGAIIGALYASGLSGRDLKDRVKPQVASPELPSAAPASLLTMDSRA